MGATERAINRTLWNLDRRLARIEAHLQLPPIDGVESTDEAGSPAWLKHVVTVKQQRGQDAIPEVIAGAPATEDSAPEEPAPLPVPAVVPSPIAAPVMQPEVRAPVEAPPLPPRPAPRPKTDFEQTIGLKWSGWVGAVVVVIGVALGIKYAYDQRWFEILPPGGRLALMSLAAFALIGAGEVVFRRIHVFAAACLYGAGVATLFLVSYAGFGYYRLYEQQTAFLLMALSTLAGAAVAMRGGFVSIAVLAQIGGNLAPILLRTDQPRLVPFCFYLLTLQAVALALAYWGGRAKWWTLRGLSLATTALWMSVVVTAPVFHAATGAKLAFSLLFAALFQAELILSAVRTAAVQAAAEPAVTFRPLGINLTAKRGVTFSLLVTALLTIAVLVILHGASDAARGAWVLGLAAACAFAGFVLTNDRADARHNLGIGFRIQAAALVVAAVPVALAGIWIVVGWAVLALAFATLGNALNLRISRWAGVMVWRLAVLYLAWWTIDPFTRDHREASHRAWLHLLGADVRAYTVLAWFLACVGHAVAWLAHPATALEPGGVDERKARRLAWVTSASAAVVWITASVAGLPPVGATLAMIVYAWLLLAADLAYPRLRLVLQSAVVVALATIKWLAVDTLAERLSPGWSATARTPVFNALTGVGLLLSLTTALLYWLRRDVLWRAAAPASRHREGAAIPGFEISPAAPAIALAGVLAFLFTACLTFEIDRIIEAATGIRVWPLWQFKQMAWTVLWSAAVAALVALAHRLEPAARLRPPWVGVVERLALVLAVKFLLVDTLLFRAWHAAALAGPVVNFQAFTALVVVGALALVAYLTRRSASPADARATFAAAGFLAVLVVLWAGTLEIDRWFEGLMAAGSTTFNDPRRAKQVAFSIFWSLFAVGSVVAGFRFRARGLRYFGLGLFAVTLLKVVLVDMSQVQTGYRVLSFLGLGLLMMGTSVLYGKLSPMLLREREGSVEEGVLAADRRG